MPSAGTSLHAVHDVALLACEAEAVLLVVYRKVDGRLLPGVRLCEVRTKITR